MSVFVVVVFVVVIVACVLPLGKRIKSQRGLSEYI